ncbi:MULTISPECIES: restriction endonuclease subunit S [Heyndrickxia]|uniref:restriction endonuclease subunit S n=1 Tax=Heyndrickxia TaxID=2837504 RepID=UPI002DB89B9F|nr:restriction endonuclease subunit S [Weizmannia sp. CD-2023]MEC2222566.1 restriction endonuclease subunit S [Weizmannia sp. CD-2023]
MSNKNSYKMYPSDWVNYTFDELFAFEGGLSISRANLSNEGICYLHYGDIHKTNDNYINIEKNFDSIPKYNKPLESINKKYLLNDGDIVFADASEDYEGIGKAVVVKNPSNIPFISGLHTIVARDKTDVLNNEYKRFFLSDWNIRKQIMLMATGISVYGLSQENVRKIKVTLPKRQEQQKIASILSTWDKAIELKEKLIEQKIQQKKGLMQKLLTGEVRLPGYSGEWKKVKLGEILKERKETGYTELELLAITSSKGVVKRTEVDIKDNSSEDKSKYKRILPNDIGYNTMRMWQGVSGVSKYEGIVSPAYTILKPTNKVNSNFIGYLFKLPKIINLFRRYSQGLVSDTLNLKYENLKGIKVTIPQDVEEQKKIAEILLSIDNEIEMLQEYVNYLKQQKKGLMQLLLTGKVRVKV